MLDTAVLLGAIPKRYRDLNLNELDTYFAMTKGYQGTAGDVKALTMKKWFNTNYHYLVPELDNTTQLNVSGTKLFDDYLLAKKESIRTKPILIGPFSFLKLSKIESKGIYDYKDDIIKAYQTIINQLSELGTEWIQIDEPFLVMDLTKEDINLFEQLYTQILTTKNNSKILLQTYFGDVRDCYKELLSLPFAGIGLDFIEGKENRKLIRTNGFPDDKTLFAGIIYGKNIWRNNYDLSLTLLTELKSYASNIVLSTSCSLLHVPCTVDSEEKLDQSTKNVLAFTNEKLDELNELATLAEDDNYKQASQFSKNKSLHQTISQNKILALQERVSNLSADDYERNPAREERLKRQKKKLNLPLFPTTTIGSFPQTQEVRANRSRLKKGLIDEKEYTKTINRFIKDCIELQETIGLDVLVHGEYERNDMVEYFGEHIDGFIFTQFGWVQSYGTRCVKPPIIFSDISRPTPITVPTSVYAQSLTTKKLKGMLTGPITILNWSFPREDIEHKEQTTQISLAIRDEVLDLETAGISIIQIDEAALREKLPLRKTDWHSEYLDWAIPIFRLTHSGTKPDTQIHTHMCYSEFEDIIQDIDDLDADVISFEASRSSLDILNAIKKNDFLTEVGPGVYDIHSPRIPTETELEHVISTLLKIVPVERLWINPDCGLKTRKIEETVESLKNMVEATKNIRKNYA